jgi:hypothetical protein
MNRENVVMSLPRRNHQMGEHTDDMRSSINTNPFDGSFSEDDNQNDYQKGGFDQNDLSIEPPVETSQDDAARYEQQPAFTVPSTSKIDDSDNRIDYASRHLESEPSTSEDQRSEHDHNAFKPIGGNHSGRKDKGATPVGFGSATTSKNNPPDQSSGRPGDGVIIGAILGLVSIPAFILFIMVTMLLLSKNLKLSLEVTGGIILLFPVIGLLLGILDMAKVKKATVLGLVAVLTSLSSLGAFGYVYAQKNAIEQYAQAQIQNTVTSVMSSMLSGIGGKSGPSEMGSGDATGNGDGSTTESPSSDTGDSTGNSGSRQGSSDETLNQNGDSSQSLNDDPVFDQVQ